MFLGLDLGTTNVKALVADGMGKVLAQGSAAISLYPVEHGGVEQDLEEIWSATLAAIGQVTRSLPSHTIRAIGVSSQGGALQILDADYRPVGRVISWLDQRGHAEDAKLTAELGRDWFLQRIGHGRSGLAIGQLLRLRCENPALLQPPNRVGFVGDTIVGRLCGQAAQDGTSTGLTLLYNPARRTYDSDLLARLGIEESQLPHLIPCRQAAGTLLPDVARQTGLPAGIPVSAAMHDQYAAALGTGVVHAGEVMFGAGTAWVLLAATDQLTKPVIDDAFVCTHPVEGLHGQLVSMVNGGSALTWARQLLGLEKLAEAEIEKLIATTHPGSDGLFFWPFLTPFGASGLAPGTRGRLSGLQLSHTPAQALRAVVEGLAFELNRHLEFMRAAQIPVAKLATCGGAATSEVTPQIVADVTGLPVSAHAAHEGSTLGAIILARSLVEDGQSLAKLAEEMTPSGRLIKPGRNVETYRGLYACYLQSLPRQSGKHEEPQSAIRGEVRTIA
jgi:xylulokinase